MTILLASGLNYQLRRSQRAKRLRIVVKANLIEVVAPVKTPEQQIIAFVSAQLDWIKLAQKRVCEQADEITSFAPSHYCDGVNIPFKGQQIPMQLKICQTELIKIQLHNHQLFIISLPKHALDSEQSSELIRQALIRWMKIQARQQAKLLIEKYSQQLPAPRSVKIKTQTSRWGSCGPWNDINLNWLLILAPPEVFEYVVVHELCHIPHKNHSSDFWNMVSIHYPDFQNQRHWLKQQGARLMKGL